MSQTMKKIGCNKINHKVGAQFLDEMFSRTFKSTCAACVGTGLAAIGMSEILNRSIALAEQSKEEKHKVLIIGGGTAGTTVANQIVRKAFSKVSVFLKMLLLL